MEWLKISGVSLAEYIRRRKMTQAAFELQGQAVGY